MAGLRFKIAELEREIKAMKSMGEEFFEPQTLWTLKDLLRDLQSIGEAQKGKARPLELQCLHTIPSDQYDRKSGKKIHAVISGKWQLRPLEKSEIEFCGIASTRIELYASDDPDKRLAMWRIPNWVPIPRLPSLFITPMSAIEFILGELFQNDWPEVTASNTKHVQNWRALQKKWLQKLFLWYRDQIEKAGSSSWVALKEAKPEDGMFL